LEAYAVIFPIESLYCSFVLQQSDRDIPIVHALLAAHDYQITVRYSGIYHAFAADSEHEAVASGQKVLREWEYLLAVFHGQDRLPGRNATDHGDTHHSRTLCFRKASRHQLDRPSQHCISADEAAIFEIAKMCMNRRTRTQVHGFSDLSNGGWIPPGLYMLKDKLKNLTLSRRHSFSHADHPLRI
jgi:hypothetical protein